MNRLLSANLGELRSRQAADHTRWLALSKLGPHAAKQLLKPDVLVAQSTCAVASETAGQVRGGSEEAPD